MRRAGYEAGPFQGVDQPRHCGTCHSGAFSELRGGQRGLGPGPLAIAPKCHQHSEAALGDVVLCEVGLHHPEGFVAGAQKMQKNLGRRRIQIGKFTRGLEEALVTWQVGEHQQRHLQNQ